MRTFIFIPGAGGSTWVWCRVTPLLVDAGHEAILQGVAGDPDSRLAGQADRFFRSACSAGSLQTDSASKPTSFRVGTCCHSCSDGWWPTTCSSSNGTAQRAGFEAKFDIEADRSQAS
jgi:hypothetical protein